MIHTEQWTTSIDVEEHEDTTHAVPACAPAMARRERTHLAR